MYPASYRLVLLLSRAEETQNKDRGIWNTTHHFDLLWRVHLRQPIPKVLPKSIGLSNGNRSSYTPNIRHPLF